jgi:hypothetical protein
VPATNVTYAKLNDSGYGDPPTDARRAIIEYPYCDAHACDACFY